MNGTKHLIAIVCMLMMPLFLHAQSKSLFITFSDNTRAEFTLASQPEISFGDDMLKVKAGDQSVSYELKRVLTFTYGASTGVRQVESDMAFKMEGNTIVAYGNTPRIRVFAIDGKAVNLTAVKMGNCQTIDIGQLPEGVYIVNVNGKSIKVARK